MRPPAKLSYRSAIPKKVVFGSGDAWTLPQIQGEVGGDQEPPSNTWRYPMGSKFFLLILNHILMSYNSMVQPLITKPVNP